VRDVAKAANQTFYHKLNENKDVMAGIWAPFIFDRRILWDGTWVWEDFKGVRIGVSKT